MKCVVTGGCGFIGSHLVEKLINEGNEVTVIDNLSTGRLDNISSINDKLEIINADISIRGNWESSIKNKDWIFHLAALADIVPSIEKPQEYYESNVQGTFNLIQSCIKFDIKKFIFSASSSCYGIPRKYPTTETDEIDPQYPYALTKRISEELIMHWSKIYKLPAISLRLFNVYGTRSRTSTTYGALFGILLAQKLANKPFTIVGNGEQRRDFTYVTDVVEAFIMCAKSEHVNKIYNIGSGNTTSINEIVEILKGNKIYIPKRPGEPDITHANIEKVVNEIGWSPKIDIKNGIKLLLEDIEYWREAPIWTPKSISQATELWFKYIK